MSKSSAWFLAKFLAAAGALFWLWSQGGGWEPYARLVLAAAGVVSPWLTGYQVDDTGGTAVFVGGPTRLALPLNLRETCVGLVPFAALVLATAKRSAASRAKAL